MLLVGVLRYFHMFFDWNLWYLYGVFQRVQSFVQLVQVTHVSLVSTIASKKKIWTHPRENKHPKQCKSEILYILYKEEYKRIIKRPILLSSSGQQDFMSHSLSKTKGHLPQGQGVQLDIHRCTEAILHQWPLHSFCFIRTKFIRTSKLKLPLKLRTFES